MVCCKANWARSALAEPGAASSATSAMVRACVISCRLPANETIKATHHAMAATVISVASAVGQSKPTRLPRIWRALPPMCCQVGCIDGGWRTGGPSSDSALGSSSAAPPTAAGPANTGANITPSKGARSHFEAVSPSQPLTTRSRCSPIYADTCARYGMRLASPHSHTPSVPACSSSVVSWRASVSAQPWAGCRPEPEMKAPMAWNASGCLPVAGTGCNSVTGAAQPRSVAMAASVRASSPSGRLARSARMTWITVSTGRRRRRRRICERHAPASMSCGAACSSTACSVRAKPVWRRPGATASVSASSPATSSHGRR
ncbi:hypothetical protein PTE30175_01959 [Pandoraea terrae]|uniref:Uncharacterized protein n=1 Tax=Pandoraea terrae TaxID=1537710 RepID=A0A5E4UHU8_9BURK|nr:hypothetical protein PTE30175_01959 [Pandoraea terrae]